MKELFGDNMASNNFPLFSGKHSDSSNIKNVLDYAKIVSPHNNAPLSEALIFGIAGGISAGYSFCPSVPRYGYGSGVTVLGRHVHYDTTGDYYKRTFDRLGLKTEFKETTGKKAAFNHLKEALNKYHPAIVWCGGFDLPYFTKPFQYGECSMHNIIVYDLDEEKNQVFISDQAAKSFIITLEELELARASVCSHKNRLMTLTSTKINDIEPAIRSGLKANHDEMTNPKIKSFSIDGLSVLSKMLNNSTNKSGWRKVFPDGKILLPLRDLYLSIELVGTGGGLFRHTFADFLNESGEILSDTQLNKKADDYHEVGKQWTEFAHSALPDDIDEFKLIKQLLSEKKKCMLEYGGEALPKLTQMSEQLVALENKLISNWPLSTSDTNDLLNSLSQQLLGIIQNEKTLL